MMAATACLVAAHAVRIAAPSDDATPSDAAEAWEFVMSPPVIVAGHINTTRFRQGGRNNTVSMLDDGLSIPCLFWGMEWPYARTIWSNEQSYAVDHYTRMPTKQGFFTENTPFPLSTDAGKHWRDPRAGKAGPMLPQPPAQAMHAQDDPPGILRSVAGSVPCACAGATCSLRSNLQRQIAHGKCLPIALGGTVPEPPWFNFSAGRSIVYSRARNGTVVAAVEERLTLFYGLPPSRGAVPQCTRPRANQGPVPDAAIISDTNNPIRLPDGSLLINFGICLNDRPLPWKRYCKCGSTPSPLCPSAISRTVCTAQNGTWTSGLSALTQVVFRSVDEGRSWKYQGVIANPADSADRNSSMFSIVGTTPELAIVQLADGRTLSAIWRPDGDCSCQQTSYGNECGKYRYYSQSFSSDVGETWSSAKMMNGMGCVDPRLLALGPWDGYHLAARRGPVVLSGGRNCVENVTDIFLWLSSDGMATTWKKYSVSYYHNQLWGGDSVYRFDDQINNSLVFASQGYTTMIQTAPYEFVLTYNKYYHPTGGAPGCQHDDGRGNDGHGYGPPCSTAFAMTVTAQRTPVSPARHATTTITVCPGGNTSRPHSAATLQEAQRQWRSVLRQRRNSFRSSAPKVQVELCAGRHFQTQPLTLIDAETACRLSGCPGRGRSARRSSQVGSL
jgi:hypothetical protein